MNDSFLEIAFVIKGLLLRLLPGGKDIFLGHNHAAHYFTINVNRHGIGPDYAVYRGRFECLFMAGDDGFSLDNLYAYFVILKDELGVYLRQGGVQALGKHLISKIRRLAGKLITIGDIIAMLSGWGKTHNDGIQKGIADALRGAGGKNRLLVAGNRFPKDKVCLFQGIGGGIATGEVNVSAGYH